MGREKERVTGAGRKVVDVGFLCVFFGVDVARIVSHVIIGNKSL